MEGCASGLHNAFDATFAAMRWAGRADPVIHPEIMLEIARRTICLPMIPQRGAACGKRLTENGSDCVRQPAQSGARAAPGVEERACGAARRNAGPMQSLADVNIAKAGDGFLIQKNRLDWRLATGEGAGERLRVEARLQRLHAEISK